MSQQQPTDDEATRYAKTYIIHGDQTKAFKAAFPGSKAKQSTHYYKASLLHKNEKIQKRIKELQEVSKKQSEEEFSITAIDIKKRLLDLADKCTKNKCDKFGNEVPASPSAAVSALSELNKMDGNHAPLKQDLTSSDGSMSPRNFNDFYKEEGDS